GVQTCALPIYRFGAGGGGRHDGHHVLRRGAVHHGLHAGAEGLHRGGAGRHRQPGGRHGRRPAAGHHRIAGRRLHRRPDRRVPGQPLPGCLRLHRAGAGADLPTLGPAGRARGRPGMSGAMKKAGLSRRNLLGIVLIGVALAVLPFVLGMAGQSWVRILNFALLYVMLALGLNIVVGFAGLLDLGYIAFYAVGAYAWALLASPHFDLHLPFWAILPISLGLACVFGVLLGAPTLKLRGDYLAIVTLGFGEIIRIFLNNLNAPVNITNGPQGINRIDGFKVGEFMFGRSESLLGIRVTGPEKYYYLLLAITLLIVLV